MPNQGFIYPRGGGGGMRIVRIVSSIQFCKVKIPKGGHKVSGGGGANIPPPPPSSLNEALLCII